MKRLFFLFAMLVGMVNFELGSDLLAQQKFRVWKDGDSKRYNMPEAQILSYGSAGTTLVVGDSTYQVSDIDSVTIIHQVPITFSEESVTYTLPAAVADDITVEADGAYVTVTNTNVSNEVEFILSGSSNNGAFTYVGTYKATICLNGLSLTSQKGAAIDIQCDKRIALILADGTTNTFADYSLGEQKACFNCKGHMEVEGSGTLNVTGNLNHAIRIKEYLQLKESTGIINIVKSNSDGIHVGQYYRQDGGTVNVTSTTVNDGIQSEIVTLDDDVTPDPDKEFNGQVFINGGTINIEIARDEDQSAIKADSHVTIAGGTLTLTVSSNGSRGIQTDGSMIIGVQGGTYAAPIITITSTGGLCTKEVHEDDPHRSMGIKVEGDLTIYSGVTKVNSTGNKARSIKVTGNYYKKGGAVSANPAIKAANL